MWDDCAQPSSLHDGTKGQVQLSWTSQSLAAGSKAHNLRLVQGRAGYVRGLVPCLCSRFISHQTRVTNEGAMEAKPCVRVCSCVCLYACVCIVCVVGSIIGWSFSRQA